MGLGRETMTYKFYNRFFMTHGQEFVTIQLQEEIPIREICLVYDYQHPLNSAARQFVTMCKNC